MEEMFRVRPFNNIRPDKLIVRAQNVNEGLSRRFAMKDAFVFEDYSDEELLQVIGVTSVEIWTVPHFDTARL
jgi:hypothetical protein